MLYCPENITITDIWIHHGVSDCFMDTVSAAWMGLFLFTFGTFQLYMYKKYGTPVSFLSLPTSWLYLLQMFLTGLLSMIVIVKFVLQVVLINHGHAYGYMVFSTLVMSLAYSFSAVLILVERNYLLPSLPTRGHGLVLLLFWTFMFISENLMFINLHREDWWTHLETKVDKVEMALFVTKYVTSLLVFVLGLKAPGIITSRDYFNLSTSALDRLHTQENSQGSTWRDAWRKMSTLLPFLWPKKNFLLQLKVVICIVLLIAGRGINLFVPIYHKHIVNALSELEFCWDLVLVYVGFKFLQGGGTGGMGLLNNLRSFLWIKIQQYTTREVEVQLFSHLHGLSLRWHLSRKTGEVLRVMDRGTDSINNLLSYILFNIFPTITDIIIACIYFVYAFNIWFGLIVFATMFLYIVATIGVTEWRTKFQRRMNLADNATKARSVDSLLNFETVKYYGAEDYEVSGFREAVLKFQDEEWKSIITLNILNTLQNVTVCGGLLGGSLLCAYMVSTTKTLTVGDYVLFASYILQLYVPLNWFGTYYRAIQKNFVDMENMFDLMSEKAEVTDVSGAPPLVISHGAVEFRNVSFSYIPERQVLNNVSFQVPAGKTLALVGPSGGGKSTIVRLLFRFYDVGNGEILIDGQNVRAVKQSSLRQAIGVVPQDTVLFNNSIKYNILYGKTTAAEADVVAAARSADIHEKILTFPDSYNTQVGERGLKLSGGEKQRVAIARTILKSPAVVLLDEATSALDTQTERNIQAALAEVCSNRTTIVVAHRLSTIIHADEIAVLKDGEIVERGRHEVLIKAGGEYAQMWAQQLKNDAAGERRTSTDSTQET